MTLSRHRLLTARRALCLFGAGLTLHGIAAAEPAPDESRQGTVYVYGTGAGYDTDETHTATRTDTPITRVPQAVTVLTRDLLDDQALTSIADALRLVPGVTVAQGEGHRDAPILRGNTTTADFFIDGVRDDLQYIRDIYNTDRLEVLKGPSGMVFGRGTGGGVINRVTKTANGETEAAATLSLGSFDHARLAVDIGGDIGAFKARLNGVAEDSGSYRDGVVISRAGLAPVAAFDLGAATRLTLSGEYFSDDRTTDRGVASFGGRPFAGSEKAFFGNPDASNSEITVGSISAAFDHAFTGSLNLRATLVYADYDKFYSNTFANGPISATGTVQLAAYTAATARENLLGQADLTWKGDLAGTAHTVLAGVELSRQETDNLRTEGQFAAANNAERLTVSVADRGRNAAATFGRVSRENRNDLELAAVYLQDQIALTDRVDVIAGLRFDQFDLAFEDLRGADFSRQDTFTSPRLGLVVSPRENLSLYASWSRAFLPQSGEQFGNLTATLARLKPESFENTEIGLKWEPREELLVTAALYQLDRANTVAPGPVAGTAVLTGSQRSEGLELSVQGEILPGWDMAAAYAWQAAEITTTTSAAPKGRAAGQVPEHSASLWNKVSLTDRFSLGGGLVWRGEMFATVSNAVVIPSFTRADAALYYDLSDRLTVQLNLENLTGETYFISAHNDNNITPGAPLTGKLTLQARF
jgi:catecholate siderophore receptor